MFQSFYNLYYQLQFISLCSFSVTIFSHQNTNLYLCPFILCNPYVTKACTLQIIIKILCQLSTLYKPQEFSNMWFLMCRRCTVQKSHSYSSFSHIELNIQFCLTRLYGQLAFACFFVSLLRISYNVSGPNSSSF